MYKRQVKYRFQRLTDDQLDWVEAGDPGDRVMYRRAFLAGVIRIEGGEWSPPWTPEGDDPSRIACAREELGDRVCRAEMQDVGHWIYMRSMLGKGLALTLPPLRSSLAAWDASARQFAASSQRSPASSSAESNPE